MTEATRESEEPDASLERRILDAFPRLTDKQRAIARVVLADHLSAAFASVDDLGRRAGVDSATVVRFAQLLGYSGWVDLRRAVREAVPGLLTAAEKVSSTSDGDVQGVMARKADVVDQDLRNIRETAIINGDETLEAAVEAIAGARYVFVVGLGLEACIADVMTLQLLRNGLHAIRVDRNLATSALHLVDAGAEDVVVGVAVWRYVRDTVRMFDEARRLGAQGVALTDSLVSPLAANAEIVLLAADSAPRLSHSLTGMLSLVNVLADAVALAARGRSVSTLRRLDGMFDDFDAVFD